MAKQETKNGMKTQSFLSWLMKSLLFSTGVEVTFCQSDFWQPTNGPYGYSIRALVTKSNTCAFAGTYGGGVFRLIDNSGHWTAVNDGLTTMYVNALAINSKGEIFAGTIGGIFRSTNNGETWTSTNTGLTAIHILCLAIDSSGSIWAGTLRSGIFRSMDNGTSWQLVGIPEPDIYSLAISPNGYIFAATNCCLNAGNRIGNVFRSPSNNPVWALVYSLSRGTWIDSSIWNLVVSADGQIFAAISTGGITRSTDDGKTWTTLALSATDIFVWCLGINTKGRVFAGTFNDGVFCSIDNGEKWTMINGGLTTAKVTCFAINSDGYVYVGMDSSGVYRSVQSTTSVKASNRETQISFYLEQNYPNPFNPSTTIQFSLVRSGYVTLKIYNARGEEMTTLVAKNLSAGKHQVMWETKGLASGVYFYRLQAADFVQTRKLVLLR